MEAKSVGAEDSAHHSEEDEDDAQQRYGNRTSERGGTEDTYELIIQVAWCVKLVTLMQLVQFYLLWRRNFQRQGSGNSNVRFLMCALTANSRERAPAYTGQISAPRHGGAVPLHKKQYEEEFSLVPPECQKKLTNG